MSIFYNKDYKLIKTVLDVEKGKITSYYFQHEDGKKYFAKKNIFGVFVPKGIFSEPFIGDTLTFENLNSIYKAMKKIKEIDRSDFFKNYFKEVEKRIKEAKSLQNKEYKQTPNHNILE